MYPFRTALLFLFVLGTRGLFADANSTKISAAEYFVDTDPGEGSGTALSAQDGMFDSEVESIAPIDLNVSGLAVGPHLIGIRYKDDNNTWGEVLYQTIHVYDANPSGGGAGGGSGGGASGSSGGFATIQAAEYFVDTDPGEGNGTAFQAQDGAFDSEVESILPKDLNVTGLAVGPHLIGIRYKDDNNTWGEVLYQTIHVYDANPSGGGPGGGGNGGGAGSSSGFATIQAAEYFLDVDPGEGNGTAFQAQDGAFDSEVESILPKDLNITGLAVGPHLVGVRYQDNNNTWGEVLYQTIHVYDANPSGGGSGVGSGDGSGSSAGFATIQAAEYFVDTDPGEGNGTAFQAQDGAFDSEVESILPKDLNVTGLAVGPHLVGVRYQDDNNTWGEVLYQTIHVYDANPSGGGPGGGGNGGGTGSSGGFATIQAAEYFVDVDPGEGNGTAFQAQDGAFDSEVESILPKDLNVTGLAVGPHLVGVRYQDNNGTWGEVLYQTIHVYDANPEVNASASGNGGSGGSSASGGFTVIAGAEYFIGNDPGEGNATALEPKDGAFDSEVESTLTASLSLQGYPIGVYLVGVRYMDNEGTWGDVLYKAIEVDVDTDGDGLADKAEAFYDTNATVQDTDGDGYLDGEEVAFGSDPTDASSLGNRAPTDLNATSALSILENLPSGEFVAEFNATDSEANATLTYSFTDGNGSSGNIFFSIDSNGTLRTAMVLDYESNSSHSIRVRVSDEHNYSSEQTFTVQVQDMDEGTAPALGDGSEQNPYQIDTLAHLKWLSFTKSVWQNKYFIQTSDINASETKNWANGYGFSPIGVFQPPGSRLFKGSYDGNGKTIFGLYINRPNRSDCAMFGRIALGSSIQNLNLVEISITGKETVGGLVGSSAHCVIINCFVDGIISGSGKNIGGIAGLSDNATIERCVVMGTISGSEKVGGLVGSLANSMLKNCSFDGHVSGVSKLGGTVGITTNGSRISRSTSSGFVSGSGSSIGGFTGMNYTKSEIFDSYSLATVSGFEGSVGGFLGFSGDSNQSSVIRCYSAGQVNQKGFIGQLQNSKVSASFWDINSSGVSTSSGTGAVGKTTAEMMDPSTFLDAGWDFNQTGGTWKMTAGQTYPQLAWETLANTTPSDLNITAPLQVLENQPVGTLVGQFIAEDPDLPTTLTFTLVGGSNDNHFFSVDANGSLRTAASLDHEANATLTVRAKARDQQNAWIKRDFTVVVLNVVEDFDGDGIEDAHDPDDDNDGYSDIAEIAYGSDPRDANSVADTLPTDLTLSGLTVMENQPVGTVVGQFAVIDPDPKDTHTVRFNDLNANGSHNHLFTIDANNTLRTAVVFDYENNASAMSLRAKVKQNQTAVFWKFFTINLVNQVEDVDGDGIENAYDSDNDNDGYSDAEESAYGSDPLDANSVANAPPDNLFLSNLSILENLPAGAVVGKLSGSDPDGNASLSFARTPGPGSRDNALFFVGPQNNLRALSSLDFETNSTLRIRLRVSDDRNASFTRAFVLSVLNDPADDPAPPFESPASPNDGYSTPDGSLSSPDDHYQTPDGQPASPSDGYHTPDQGYQSPDDKFRSPSDHYQTLDGQPASPSDGYHTPDQGYQSPDDKFRSPSDHYQTPDGQPASPSDGYHTPDQGYQSPDDKFRSPSDDYQTPDGQPASPSDGYHTPDQGYQSPDDNFTSPSDDYQTPDDAFVPPIDDYQSPQEEYATPTEEYEPPQPQHVPIVHTMEPGQDENGVPLLRGKVLADGGAEIIDAGFILSPMDGGPDLHLQTEVSPGTGEFFSTLPLQPGQAYRFRAYAQNSVGETLGVEREISGAVPEEQAASWQGFVLGPNGWVERSWIGSFRPYESGWLFHLELGWAYAHPDGSGGLWLWMPEEGWVWTQDQTFPFLYAQRSADWLYLIRTEAGIRIYDYARESLR